jgi:hypothetical protein
MSTKPEGMKDTGLKSLDENFVLNQGTTSLSKLEA